MNSRPDNQKNFLNAPLPEITALIIQQLPRAAAARFLISTKKLYFSRLQSTINHVWRQYVERDFPSAYRDYQSSDQEEMLSWFDVYKHECSRNAFFYRKVKNRKLYFAMMADDLAVVVEFAKKASAKKFSRTLFNNYVGLPGSLLDLASISRSTAILDFIYSHARRYPTLHINLLNFTIICRRDMKEIERLSKGNPACFLDRQHCDLGWQSPVEVALSCDNKEVIQISPVHSSIDPGMLADACRFGNFDVIKHYLSSSENKLQKKNRLCSSIRGTIRGGYSLQLPSQLELYERILANYPDSSTTRSVDLYSFIETAIGQDQRKCLEILIAFKTKKTHVFALYDTGCVNISIMVLRAVQSARLATFKILIQAIKEEGIDLNLTTSGWECIAIEAVKSNAQENWQFLTECGASLQINTPGVENKLRAAFILNRSLTLRLLLSGNLVKPSLLTAIRSISDLNKLRQLPPIENGFLLEAIRDKLPADVLNAIIARCKQPLSTEISPEDLNQFDFKYRFFISHKVNQLKPLMALSAEKRANIKAQLEEYQRKCNLREPSDYKTKLTLFGHAKNFGFNAGRKSGAVKVAIAIIDGIFDEEKYTIQELNAHFAAISNGTLGNIFRKTGIDLNVFKARGTKPLAPTDTDHGCEQSARERQDIR